MGKFGIIGAGVAGLAAAWELSQHGHTAIIYEAQPEVGGLAAGFKDSHWEWSLEKFYHHWFASDSALLQLADELGVRHKILFPRPKTSMWMQGAAYQLDSPISALRFPLMSWPEKIRFGVVTLFLRLTSQWAWLEKYTADEWLQRYLGKSLYERIWRPMLIGKFGEFYREVNMAWFWARIHSRTPRLGTYEGGFQAFVDEFAAALRQRGVQICLNLPVEKVERQADGKVTVQTAAGTETFDAVISTSSPRLLLKMIPQISGAYAQQVETLRHMGAVCVVVALNQKLMHDQTYWLNLPAQATDREQNEFPFLALVEHTNYVSSDHFGGDHILYMGDYVPTEHEYLKLSDEELAERFLPSLSTVNPSFSRSWIRKVWVFRAPYAQPLPTVHHSQNLPDLKTPVPGIYWASMSQVYPWDRGTNYAVEIGRRVAQVAMEGQA